MAESRIDAALIERVRERIGVDWRRTGEGPRFRADPYNRDPALLARMGSEEKLAELR